MKAGDTFIPVQYQNRHLWVILSDPTVDSENVVIVNFTTHTLDEESVCVISKGEHPFVRHKTCVRYRDARPVSLDQLKTVQNAGLLSRHAPLSAALLKRVREGAALSEFLPEGCKRILEDQGLI